MRSAGSVDHDIDSTEIPKDSQGRTKSRERRRNSEREIEDKTERD